MKVSMIGFNGITFTFNSNEIPLTTGMKKLITGETMDTITSPAKLVKKIEITRGESSPQTSCKKRFVTPLSWEDQDCSIAPRRNAGRKTKGKKPARVSIRKIFATL